MKAIITILSILLFLPSCNNSDCRRYIADVTQLSYQGGSLILCDSFNISNNAATLWIDGHKMELENVTVYIRDNPNYFKK